jgi:hypothetical protein
MRVLKPVYALLKCPIYKDKEDMIGGAFSTHVNMKNAYKIWVEKLK